MEFHLTATECHLPYGITQCYLPPDSPTQVNTPRLNPSNTGRYSIYLPRRDGRLSWLRWLVTYRWRSIVVRPSAISQPTRPTQPAIPPGSVKWVVIH